MSGEGAFHLLCEARFGPFFLTQFLGAFNDNIFKNALIILIAFQGSRLSGVDSNLLINAAAGLFILPYFLFSALFGQFADKYPKADLIRWIKVLELVLMGTAAAAFWFQDVIALMVLLFLMGTQSALFGPVKYSILPQYLAERELTAGNGLVEMGTFLAILLGTMTGGLLVGGGEGGERWVGLVLVLVAAAGWGASLWIPSAPASQAGLRVNWNLFTETWRNLRFLAGYRTVLVSVLGISWFWALGATYLAQLPNFTRLALGGNEQVVTLLLSLFSVGIGLGSLATDRLSRHRVEPGLVPLGALGLAIFAADLYFSPTAEVAPLLGVVAFLEPMAHWRVVMDILLLGAFGGVYIVPLYALIQQRSAPAYRSRVIAGNNILNALLMVLAAGMAIAVLGAGWSIQELFLGVAGLHGLVCLTLFLAVPEFPRRFIQLLRRAAS